VPPRRIARRLLRPRAPRPRRGHQRLPERLDHRRRAPPRRSFRCEVLRRALGAVLRGLLRCEGLDWAVLHVPDGGVLREWGRAWACSRLGLGFVGFGGSDGHWG